MNDKSEFDAVAFLKGLTRQQGASSTPAPHLVPVANVDDLPADWRVEFEERAAILEYDGGQAREHAEAEALREIIERMRGGSA